MIKGHKIESKVGNFKAKGQNNIMKYKKGEMDYDYKHDILFFKTKDRKYSKSIELLDNLVVDVDKEGFLVGIQIFDASLYLNVDKKNLLKRAKMELADKPYPKGLSKNNLYTPTWSFAASHRWSSSRLRPNISLGQALRPSASICRKNHGAEIVNFIF